VRVEENRTVRTRTLRGVLAVATTALALTACSNGSGTPTAQAPTPPTASTASAASASQAADHNAADVAFLQGMIPHHAQAIFMSQQAAARAASPQVKNLASGSNKPKAPRFNR
jgi:uncharacterized protein (DUF305 family)